MIIVSYGPYYTLWLLLHIVAPLSLWKDRVTLLESRQDEPGSIPGWVRSRIFACGNRAGQYLWLPGFLWDIPFPTPLHSGAAPYPHIITFIGSPDPDSYRIYRVRGKATRTIAHAKPAFGSARWERLVHERETLWRFTLARDARPRTARWQELRLGWKRSDFLPSENPASHERPHQYKTFALFPPRMGSIPGGFAPGFLHVRIVLDDAAGWRFSSGITRFSHPCIAALLYTHLTSPSSALKTSMLQAAQIFPLSSTYRGLQNEATDFHIPSWRIFVTQGLLRTGSPIGQKGRRSRPISASAPGSAGLQSRNLIHDGIPSQLQLGQASSPVQRDDQSQGLGRPWLTCVAYSVLKGNQHVSSLHEQTAASEPKEFRHISFPVLRWELRNLKRRRSVLLFHELSTSLPPPPKHTSVSIPRAAACEILLPTFEIGAVTPKHASDITFFGVAHALWLSPALALKPERLRLSSPGDKLVYELQQGCVPAINGIVPDDDVGRRVFSGIPHFPRFFTSFRRRFVFTSITLIGSEDLYDVAALEFEGGETGLPRENPPTNGIVQHDSHTRKPGSEHAEIRTRTAVLGVERASHCATAVFRETMNASPTCYNYAMSLGLLSYLG
ncbi:hypothetical protein PR048_031603 [Dryococelus australis]|uniref:Uncharacterized protein n=1 Tax=Dryococelus australis TaxID=614101 RepID=A0ABQ9G6E7_9NEOP|nr:hypothetical protein PR048_031603 [Dryococelus australis]